MFCNNCGTQNPDNGTFCVGCGQSLQQAAAAQPPQQEYYQQQAYQQQAAPEAPAVDEAQDAQANKVMGILAYILFFIPLVTGDAKKSPFVQFHTNQGLVLFIAGIASMVIAIIPILGWILAPILGIVVFVFAILGILNAVKGEKKPLPLIGGITILK